METCSAGECDRDGAVKGLCRKHYMRQIRKGSTDGTRKNARKECSADGCGRLTAAQGLCDMHYRRARHKPTRHEGRRCERCSGPIPTEKKAGARFCSRECKLLASQPARSRRYMLKTKYGLTEATFDEMLERQGGGCGICGTQEPQGRGQRLHVDHDHKTGQVRGLLCTSCNNGLGRFHDDVDLLRAAVAYLQRA